MSANPLGLSDHQTLPAVRNAGLSVHPLRPIDKFLITPAVEAVSKLAAGRKYQFSRVVRFVGGLATMVFIFAYVYGKATDQRRDVTLKYARANSNALLEFLENDLRGHVFFPGLLSSGLPMDSILISAATLRMGYDEYYQKIMEMGSKPSSTLIGKLSQTLPMAPVRDFFEKDLGDLEGFLVPQEKRGPISQAHKHKIFEIENRMAVDLEIAYELGGLQPMTKTSKAVVRTPEAQARKAELLQDPIIKQIIGTSPVAGFHSFDIVRTIQTHLYWQRSFAIWDTLGINKYKLEYDKNGEPVATERLLKPADIEQQVLDLLKAS